MSQKISRKEWIEHSLQDIEKELLQPKRFDPSRGAEFVSNQYVRNALKFCQSNITSVIEERRAEIQQQLLDYEPQRMDDLFVLSKLYAWLFTIDGVLHHE